jgi:hypothetical protein
LLLQEGDLVLQASDFVGELAVAAFLDNEDQRIERAHCLVIIIVLAIECHQGTHECRIVDNGMGVSPRSRFWPACNGREPHHEFTETFAAARTHLGMQRLVFGIISAKLFEVLSLSLCTAAARSLRARRLRGCTIRAV